MFIMWLILLTIVRPGDVFAVDNAVTGLANNDTLEFQIYTLETGAFVGATVYAFDLVLYQKSPGSGGRSHLLRYHSPSASRPFLFRDASGTPDTTYTVGQTIRLQAEELHRVIARVGASHPYALCLGMWRRDGIHLDEFLVSHCQDINVETKPGELRLCDLRDQGRALRFVRVQEGIGRAAYTGEIRVIPGDSSPSLH